MDESEDEDRVESTRGKVNKNAFLFLFFFPRDPITSGQFSIGLVSRCWNRVSSRLLLLLVNRSRSLLRV